MAMQAHRKTENTRETLPGTLYSWQRFTSSQSSASNAASTTRYSTGSI